MKKGGKIDTGDQIEKKWKTEIRRGIMIETKTGRGRRTETGTETKIEIKRKIEIRRKVVIRREVVTRGAGVGRENVNPNRETEGKHLLSQLHCFSFIHFWLHFSAHRLRALTRAWSVRGNLTDFGTFRRSVMNTCRQWSTKHYKVVDNRSSSFARHLLIKNLSFSSQWTAASDPDFNTCHDCCECCWQHHQQASQETLHWKHPVRCYWG